MTDAEHKHIDGEWPVLGRPVKYRAHIIAVRGRDRSQEVIDDIHVTFDVSTLNERQAAFLSDQHTYDRIARQIVDGEVLTKYLLQSIKPPPE